MNVESLPEALPEGVDDEAYVIATYFVCANPRYNVYKIAPAIAVEQSTGTWVTVPGETEEVRRTHVAKVIGIYEIPHYEFELPEVTERTYLVQIAFPWVNFGAQIPMMLTTVVGNISMGGKIKLMDLKFPKSFTKGFKGAKFGIKGIRKILNVPERPLLNNMIKPCTGYPPQAGKELFYEAARGGADIIKDDELLANAPFNTLEERIPLYMEAADRAEEEKGEKTLYAANVTDRIPHVLENAEKAIELGTNCIMINYLTAGISVLRALADDPSITVPILAHMDFAGALYESPFSGIASPIVLGKLPRLAGADIIVFPAPYGKAPYLKERYIQTAKTMTYPFHAVAPVFPMPSGGIAQPMVDELIKDLGYDIVIGAGGAIHAHPMGPAAGSRAFRQAIDAVMEGRSIDDAAEEHEELAQSIEASLKAIKEMRDLMG
ncbi:MAG: ribulose 1,5-bisphosphate carboxylase [Theionarchaea archaeon]|nr:ribulose 1,5-bisphosphate carboxylase [Theionarchaea archaeon]MBU6999290.1 ribulose 1,5-bisphosphate carboxylase [Theionarchaea archaeon]MBU7019585.1 ribulose 1,5-bisphosphate carboxylase [Theionarchaea archaeon]MBU7033764.1 ribulose 1,5-bisphosphate carboxylase [Theionarchaea archaeon]MBU7039426.1 ribulose 1,5-bisphosphate carboxylase [Theionarchaea archaeon]